jgi:2,4-dienoyl-CoA reductase-like NADH-dependent reductase (Old Yellow Enzyme family)
MRFPLEVLRAVRAATVAHHPHRHLQRVASSTQVAVTDAGCELTAGSDGSDRAPILVKFNLGDGFSGGQTLPDAIDLARAVHAEGLADLLVPSGGWITRNGLFMLRWGGRFIHMHVSRFDWNVWDVCATKLRTEFWPDPEVACHWQR